MSQQLFLNKYQPQLFSQFEIDSEIINILTTLINMNNLNILFIGDIGSGKTAFLNATIREYYGNANPSTYQDNILYINSLKEQGINYYRTDVKTFCQSCSSIPGKKKIVVLDDIDLINEQSQQVFRNCIDKYMHNVHFIASCTNSQKVIESLQSRLIIIKIKPLNKDNLKIIMEKIIQKEELQLTPQAQNFVLSICNNNAKILISYMEKFKLLNQIIDEELVVNVCTNISFNIFNAYTCHLKNNELKEAVTLLYSVYDKGYSVMDILDNYFLFVKFTNELTEEQKYEIIPLLCKYITIFNNIHEDEIELALFSNNLCNALNKMN